MNPLRAVLRSVFPARMRSGLIGGFAKLNCWYAKGIAVLSFVRNMEITDIGILMGVAKYLFGDALSSWQIVGIGAGYWTLNTLVNLCVGWFWEHHSGWEIEARVVSKRITPQRTILVDPETGQAYGLKEMKEACHGRND